MDTIGLLISMALTLMIFSYILGDNPLFRLAEHIFVGVSVGYAILVAFHLVIAPTFTGQAQGGLLIALPAAILSLMLVVKLLPTQTKLGSAFGAIPLAFLVGVGAAVAVGGAVMGTLLPQAGATASIDLSPANPLYSNAVAVFVHNQWLSNIVIIIGTVGALFYFSFATRPTGRLAGFQSGFVNFWAGMGRWIILITLGALFANSVSAKVALLVGRIQFLAQGMQDLLGL